MSAYTWKVDRQGATPMATDDHTSDVPFTSLMPVICVTLLWPAAFVNQSWQSRVACTFNVRQYWGTTFDDIKHQALTKLALRVQNDVRIQWLQCRVGQRHAPYKEYIVPDFVDEAAVCGIQVEFSWWPNVWGPPPGAVRHAFAKTRKRKRD